MNWVGSKRSSSCCPSIFTVGRTMKSNSQNFQLTAWGLNPEPPPNELLIATVQHFSRAHGCGQCPVGKVWWHQKLISDFHLLLRSKNVWSYTFTPSWKGVYMRCLAVVVKVRSWESYLVIWITWSACFVIVTVCTQSSCKAGGWCSWWKLSYIVARCTRMCLPFREVIFRTFKTRTTSTLTISSSTTGCTWGSKGNTYKN
jgi:hypothetical protein